MRYTSYALITSMVLLAGCKAPIVSDSVSAPTQTRAYTQAVPTVITFPTTPLSPSLIPVTAVQPTELPVQPSNSATVMPPPTPQPGAREPRLPPYWQTLEWKTWEWQRISMPIPKIASWEITSRHATVSNNAPIIAAGVIVYHPPRPGLEFPSGPGFVIFQFAGSLDEWLDEERHNSTSAAGNKVMEDTIQETKIANRRAITYQRAFSGTDLIDYYILKLSDDELLWVVTDHAISSILNGLVIKE